MTGTNISDKQAFAALLASKLCHDLISPVSALGNALELLEMEDDAAMREAALSLLADGAAQAARRLRFYRLAFGAAGGVYEVDGRDIKQAAEEFVKDTKPSLEWHLGPESMPLGQGKVLLNLTAVIAEALPRGGTVSVFRDEDGFLLSGTGPMVRLPDEFVEVLEGLRKADSAREAALGLICELLEQEALSLTIDQAEEALRIAVTKA